MVHYRKIAPKDCLRECLAQVHFNQKDDIPPNSPDLDPLEYAVWSAWKGAVITNMSPLFSFDETNNWRMERSSKNFDQRLRTLGHFEFFASKTLRAVTSNPWKTYAQSEKKTFVHLSCRRYSVSLPAYILRARKLYGSFSCTNDQGTQRRMTKKLWRMGHQIAAEQQSWNAHMGMKSRKCFKKSAHQSAKCTNRYKKFLNSLYVMPECFVWSARSLKRKELFEITCSNISWKCFCHIELPLNDEKLEFAPGVTVYYGSDNARILEIF